MPNYQSQQPLSSEDQEFLVQCFSKMLNLFRKTSISKVTSYLSHLPRICTMHFESRENRSTRDNDARHYHPIRPVKGEIYNAFLTEGVGSELCNNHLVIIMQNLHAALYSEKVNVLPIEGDGNKVPPYLEQLCNNDLEYGRLDKDPSRVIITDIMTIDKARLGGRIGKVCPEKLSMIDGKLKKQLDI